MPQELNSENAQTLPRHVASTVGLGVGAENMAAMRMQATALAFQWFSAGNYAATSDRYAYFLMRASDFGMRADVLPGLRIKVTLSFERERTTR